MPALALWTPEDGLLGALAPLGAALAEPPAVVVDLDPHGPAYPGDRSLADLVADDPTEEDLAPRPGVAVLRNGGVSPRDAAEVVAALIERWDHVVLRVPPRPTPDEGLPVVTVRLLTGGWFQAPGAAVWQATGDWVRMPSDGVRLPVPSPDTVRALLAGRRPPARSKWVRAWRPVWGMT